jgi:hypothetical protein
MHNERVSFSGRQEYHIMSIEENGVRGLSEGATRRIDVTGKQPKIQESPEVAVHIIDEDPLQIHDMEKRLSV